MYTKLIALLILSVSLQALASDGVWTPVALDKELYPIANLESSFGKNMAHQPHSRGAFYSSYGALGLKAITAYEAYMMSPKIQRWLRPKDGEVIAEGWFFSLFTKNPEFYNRIANVHWWYLKQNTSSVEQAVFAWRFGLAAAAKASPEAIASDRYVAQYVKLANVNR